MNKDIDVKYSVRIDEERLMPILVEQVTQPVFNFLKTGPGASPHFIVGQCTTVNDVNDELIEELMFPLITGHSRNEIIEEIRMDYEISMMEKNGKFHIKVNKRK